LGVTIKTNFYFFKSVKKILILDAIPNANLEIGSKKMTANTIALNANHSTIQQSHVEFCCLIKCFWTLWITTSWSLLGPRVEVGLPPNIMKGINIFTVNIIKDFSYNYDKIIQVLWKKGYKKWCHMALWNFRLRFEPSSLPPLTKGDNKIKKEPKMG
jgi:hypothetical protein